MTFSLIHGLVCSRLVLTLICFPPHQKWLNYMPSWESGLQSEQTLIEANTAFIPKIGVQLQTIRISKRTGRLHLHLYRSCLWQMTLYSRLPNFHIIWRGDRHTHILNANARNMIHKISFFLSVGDQQKLKPGHPIWVLLRNAHRYSIFWVKASCQMKSPHSITSETQHFSSLSINKLYKNTLFWMKFWINMNAIVVLNQCFTWRFNENILNLSLHYSSYYPTIMSEVIFLCIVYTDDFIFRTNKIACLVIFVSFH